MPAAPVQLKGYFPITFATALGASGGTSAGITIGSTTVPTGARFNILDVETWCAYSGSNGAAGGVTRVNVFQGTTSVLSSEISLATSANVRGTLTSAIVPVEAAVAITATLNGGFAGSIAAAQSVQVRITGYYSRHPNSIFGNFGFADPTTLPAFGQPA